MQSELEKAARSFMELFVNDNGSQPGLSLDGIDPVEFTDRYAALEAALSTDAEPVAWLVKRYDLEGILLDTELSFVRPTVKSTCKTEIMPLYDQQQQPAPSVAVKLDSIAHRINALARVVGTPYFEDVEKDLRELSDALSAQMQDVATAAEFSDRMFNLHGFMLCERHNGKHAVTVTFPNLSEAQQFHGALVDLSRHRTAAAPVKQEGKP